jgi:hypothetical protein
MPQAGDGGKGESLLGSTATAASKLGVTGWWATSAAGRAKRSSCFAEVASAGHTLHFSPAPQAAGASVSLSIRSYRRPVLIAQAPACAPHVLVGHTYRAGLRYSSSAASVSVELLTHTARGWSVSYVAIPRLRPSKSLKSVSVVLHPIQGGVDRVALGLLVKAHGTLRASGFSLVDVGVHPGPISALPTSVSPAPALTPAVPVGVQPALSPETTGRWTVLEGTEQARSVHAVLLQNGKVLIMAGSGNDAKEAAMHHFKSYIYDPVANTWKEVKTPEDVFCAGHVQLADGNVLILGGTKEYPKTAEGLGADFTGENASWIFNIHTEEYEPVTGKDETSPWKKGLHGLPEPGPLLGGAWYPSATELGNGDVIAFGGLNEEGEGSTKTDYYDAETKEWVDFGSTKVQQTYEWDWGLYPSMILTKDGRLFYDGDYVFGSGFEGFHQAPSGSSILDFYCSATQSTKEVEEEAQKTNPSASVTGPNGTFPRIQDTPGLRDSTKRDQAASLLLPPAQAQKVMIMGGGNTPEEKTDAINLTDEINLTEKSPHWTAGPNLPAGEMEGGGMEPMGAGKMYVSAVALPDGTVLETGGSLLPRRENVHEASIFSPSSNTFTTAAADPVGRDYHSEALLLPDGRVLALGSNPIAASGEEPFETRVSVYEPPYLFKGPRPVIGTIDGEVNHLEGQVNRTAQWKYSEGEHAITYSSASPIASAVLIRPAAVTHSSDPNQREVALPITHDSGTGELKVGLPSNPNLAPPGYYMVFLVSAQGVPSVAQWVHVGP